MMHAPVAALSLLAISTLIPLINAFTLHGQIAFNGVLPQTSLPPASRVVLDQQNERKTTFIKQDGSFIFTLADEGVEGEYILGSQVKGYVIAPLLITIHTPSAEEDKPSIHIQPYHPARQPLPISSLPSLPTNPITLKPLQKEDHYSTKNGMNILGLLKNPMVLMMAFSGVMMFALPKLIASVNDMDPELAKEMAESRKKMNGLQNMDWTSSLSNMLAGASDDAPPASSQGTPVRANVAGKKRRGR